MENYIATVKKYLDFKSRSPRREFWMFVVFNILISSVLSIIDGVLGFKTLDANSGVLTGGVLTSIFSIVILLPSLAVGTRRLHDTNRSGWWQLLGIIPVIGWIVLIVFFSQDSNADENKYGPNPKVAAAPAPVAP